MRNRKLKKNGYKIDKTVLHHSVVVRFENPEYLASFNGQPCFVCTIQDGTVVAAHIRPGWYGKSKPHDYWTIPLCYTCHEEEGRNPTRFYEKHGYTIDEIKAVAKVRYKKWREE